ncbi:TonB-dependent receptor [Prevotella brunnea]|uniref:TonB-dependent receptor n=1 Tax=Prevotella brunnea TaxID=2508867 RepID=A0A5C8GGI3_9BACT|nr:TonB-dependent receptor [Prevotella brunnea]TXJ60869.1 TonB-dependent receptor [Prevotella brunnea]
MNCMKRGFFAALLLLIGVLRLQAQEIIGNVYEAKTNLPIIGATIEIEGDKPVAVTDIDGNFTITDLKAGKYNLIVRYVGYKTKKIDGVETQASGADKMLKVALETDEKQLQEVSVTAVARRNTEQAMIQVVKNSSVIVSNISAQEISRTQDSNAGEVIRRIPGVSLIEDKFVMVRGLSQRYNNVWINGGAVPSSEADSRAFSFDIIPSSQIDNLTIVKTPAPEYPADYSGGFIIVNTKEIPTENSFSALLGGNWNTQSAFQDFKYYKGSGTDFLGFDSGKRMLGGGFRAHLNNFGNERIDLMGNELNNDWTTHTRQPFGDLKMALNWNHRWNLGEHRMGLIAMMNYSNETRAYRGMENNLFGIYDAQNDQQNYLRHSLDDQYNHNVRLGAMLNLTFLTANGLNKFQFKNIFNQIGNSRYTWREGISAQSNQEHSAEYYYRSRATYNTQFTGKHTIKNDELDWNVGYAYANRMIPDRRRYLTDDAIETGRMALTTGNDISREWTRLNEHIVSAGVNDKHHFAFGNFEPIVQAGAYAEYRTRDYDTREFIYNWDASDNNMPMGFRYMDMTELLSNPNNFGSDKLYLLEQMNMRNDYIGHNTLGAGYLSVSLPFGKLGIYAGVRFEHNNMELISNAKDTEVSHVSTYYKNNDFFPSLNATYKFNEQHQLRASYGRSINRPEFREVSSSVFYDFDLASNVQGNAKLKNCYVDNIDLRYEFYPGKSEIISLAAFYKHFDSPIEWTYTVSGGTDLIYSYKNAQSANSYGVELDIRKRLDFMGLPDFSWSFNGALIKSKVNFEAGAKEANRPMQGQSPYLINSGFFYINEKYGWNVSLLYNRIGKRIIGVGRSEGTTSGNDVNSRVPDSYEMPRDVIDLTASKKFGKHWELKLSLRDLLAQKVNYKQFADVTYADGTYRKVEEVTRSYRPGHNIGFSAIYKF